MSTCRFFVYQKEDRKSEKRTEAPQWSVVKDHGRPDFADSSRKRSRRKHRSKGIEPISTEPLLCKNMKGNVMATSDIGLLNVK